MPSSVLIERLVDGLRCLPGVGPKSARRMAYHLLERNRDGGKALAQVLEQALTQVGRCRVCRTLTEDQTCTICDSDSRDSSSLCVVESPSDLEAIESGTGYRGRYFVLMGLLSPLDGIGPEQLGIEHFERLLASSGLTEVIVATGSTVEGQATAHYVSELAREAGVRVSRLAHGIPLGGELEYVDSSTLAHAFRGRMVLD